MAPSNSSPSSPRVVLPTLPAIGSKALECVPPKADRENQIECMTMVSPVDLASRLLRSQAAPLAADSPNRGPELRFAREHQWREQHCGATGQPHRQLLRLSTLPPRVRQSPLLARALRWPACCFGL